MSNEQDELQNKPNHDSGAMLAATEKSIHFEDGIGQFQVIAALLVEVTGHVNPAREKFMGGARAEAMLEKERFEVSYNNYLLSKGVSSKPSTLQGEFDRRVKAIADHLVETAQREQWHVTDKDGIRQQPPRAWDYVDVQLVRDLYAKTKGRNHARFVEVLNAASLWQPQLSRPSMVKQGQEQVDAHEANVPSYLASGGGSVASVLVHSTKSKSKHQLSAVIEAARCNAPDPSNWVSVWDSLVKIASSGERPPPLIGYVPKEGVQYTAYNQEEPAYFSRDAFRKNFQRETSKPRSPNQDA